MNGRGVEQEVDIRFSELRERKPERLEDEDDFEITFTQAREEIEDDFELTLGGNNLDDVDIEFDVSEDELQSAHAEQEKLDQRAQQLVRTWRREAEEISESLTEADQPEKVENPQVQPENDRKEHQELKTKIERWQEAIADLRPGVKRKVAQAENDHGLISETLGSVAEYRKRVERLNQFKAELAELTGKELYDDVIDEDSELVDRILKLEKQSVPVKNELRTESIEEAAKENPDETEEKTDGFSPEMVKREIETAQEIKTRINSLLEDSEINNFYLGNAFANGTRLEKYRDVLSKYVSLLEDYQASSSGQREELKSSIFAEKNSLEDWHKYLLGLGSEISDAKYSEASTQIGVRLKNIARAASEVLDRRYW